MLTAELGDNPAVFALFQSGLAPMTSGGQPERYTKFLDALMPNASPTERMNRAWFDFFRASALRPAQALSEVGVKSWVYSFEVPTEHPYGPTHGSDVRFVFNLFEPHDDTEGVVAAFYKNNEANRRIATMWSRTLAHFARHADPNGAGLPKWPQYDTKARACLVLREKAEIIGNPEGKDALVAYGLAGKASG